MRLWRLLVDRSTRYFRTVYRQLGVRLTEADIAGESSYHDRLGGIVRELDQAGLVKESDGAACVFPQGYRNRDGEPLPLIVRKADGGFGYDATDLAAVRHRLLELGGTRLLYVVGLPQQVHLRMVFDTARAAGWAAPSVRIEHIGFGSVHGADGKALASRAGSTVRLVDLLDEAVVRATEQVRSRNPGLTAEAARRVAKAVGIGAVKYADLSTDRTRDYVFDYERMLSFDGNTAPYLQYAHARIHALLRRAGTTPAGASGPIEVGTPHEHALVLALLDFGRLVDELEESLHFHRLCGYLFHLAALFTAFYENCPVLRADSRVRGSRLALCALTARVLALGLSLLGIDAPERM
jgi:arginyl-tRNA synthetase